MKPRATGILLGLGLAACTPQPPPAAPYASPAGADTRFPRLSRGANGVVYLSWLRRVDGETWALEFSALRDKQFSTPLTVATGDDWFVNWADFPSVTAAKDGTIAAHWLQRNGSGTFSYGIRIACSTDGGATFGAPFWLHEDRAPTEHGFVSIVPSTNSFDAVWLDGRDLPKTGHMTLRTRAFGAKGVYLGERLLDAEVCECCSTAAARVGNSILAVYRDRNDGVRDIAVVRQTDGTWLPGRAVHDDGWKKAG